MGYTQKLGLLAQSVFQDSSLNVGIGAAPSGTYKLEVTGTAKVSGILTLGSTISNGTYTYTLPSATGTLALTSALGDYLPLTGGTLTGALSGTSATFSSSVTAGSLIVNQTSTAADIILKFAINGTPKWLVGLTNDVVDDNFTIYQDGAGGGNRFTINTSGNVGIGTSSPLNVLDVRQASAAMGNYQTIQAFSTDSAAINLGGGISLGGYHTGTTSIAQFGSIVGRKENGTSANYDGYLAFGTNAQATGVVERMRITSAGYVGINANGTAAQLHVSSGTNSFPIMHGFNTSSAPYGVRLTYTTSPNSNDNWFIYADDSTSQRFSVRSNGGVYNFTANNSNLSDERLKKDIVSLESVWDKIKGIEIVKYKYKDQLHDDYNMGVIAQQVETIAPELVNPDGWGTLAEDGTPYKSIYESDLNYYTIKVLQEAMTKIEDLKSRLDKAGL